MGAEQLIVDPGLEKAGWTVHVVHGAALARVECLGHVGEDDEILTVDGG